MKRILLLALCLVSFGLSAQRNFNHPGSILSQSDLDRIKTHVKAGDEPWASCWKELQADGLAKSTYTASPSAEIGGSNGTRQRAAADAYAGSEGELIFVEDEKSICVCDGHTPGGILL